jgi:hypothetical protein
MITKVTPQRSGFWKVALALAAILSTTWFPGAVQGADISRPKISDSAEQLVADAQAARLQGDTSQSFSLLRQAVDIEPEFALARWQLGQLKVDGEWLTVEEAQRREAANPKQAQYRELRNMLGETPQGQLELARWARKNGLGDESKFHWASVLAVDPTNEEALKVLNLRGHNGQLLTIEQIAKQKSDAREAKKVAKRWAPKISKWRRAIEGEDAAARDAALLEIRSLSDVEAIRPMEVITLEIEDENEFELCRQVTLALLEALNKMQGQAATESLVRHAVLSPVEAGRTTSIDELKRRPKHAFVPILLGGLGMPIESSFNVHNSADGSVHYTHSLYREGQKSDWEVDARFSSLQHILPGRRLLNRQRFNVIEDQTPYRLLQSQAAQSANRSNRQYLNTAVATEARVRNTNEYTAALNSRIIPVLVAVSGENFASPKEWWGWWTDHNEYYTADHPVDRQYISDVDHNYYGQPFDTMSYTMSCFAKGTPVWTKTGQRPVETLELGDLVLSQNVHTGELAYKPIIGRTVRPPSEIRTLSLGKEKLRTTLGHPFWVAGVGWRMAKELEDGAILHGVTGSPRVTSIEKSEKEEAYNLVIADFSTYFVGEGGVLVHDNTPRTPTRATLPGLAAR